MSAAPTSLTTMNRMPWQPTLDDIGTPLHQASFCVVDLETTGTGTEASITEIGAVKVRGGELLGEFQTLINPQIHIPAQIQVLTGITDHMIAQAPTIDQVLPTFLEFARGCVLVAHNAGFDTGFLKRACAQLGCDWPQIIVLDTVALARQALGRDEVPNIKLSTLAAFFHTAVQPTHRALDDARATVDVLHGIIERVGNLGVVTVQDLHDFQHRVSRQRRAKRTWARDLPEGPGVYYFQADYPGQGSQILYVGRSTNIRRRVGSYFTSSESRPRMDEMVRIATGVRAIECATDLEAEVRELRMIAAHSPRYNRRSKHQQHLHWLRLTHDAWPRLSIVGTVGEDQDSYLGPFTSKARAEQVCALLWECYPIRQCAQRLGLASNATCTAGQIGRCLGPCADPPERAGYLAAVEEVRQALTSTIHPTLAIAGARIRRLSDQEHFEQAREITTRLTAFTQAAMRWHRLRSLAACGQIVAASWIGSPAARPGWQIHVIRHGRLAGAGIAPPGRPPRQVAAQVVRLAETVTPVSSGLPAASVEESERVASWLERPGVRLLEVDGEWSQPWRIGVNPGQLPELIRATSGR